MKKLAASLSACVLLGVFTFVMQSGDGGSYHNGSAKLEAPKIREEPAKRIGVASTNRKTDLAKTLLTTEEVDAQYVIESQGNYRLITGLLLESSETERFSILFDLLCSTHSKLGIDYDYKIKSDLIRRFGGPRSNVILNRLDSITGELLVKDDVLASIGNFPSEHHDSIFRGAVSYDCEAAVGHLFSEDIEGSPIDSSGSLRRQALEFWLESDSIQASRFVDELPTGELGASAIQILVEWLEKKGDSESAEDWKKELLLRS